MAALIEFERSTKTEICKCYNKHDWTLRELAAMYLVSVGTIVRVLRAGKVKLRPRGRRPQ